MKFVIGIVLLFIFSQGSVAMSIFDIGKVCVFSSVKGRLSLDGEPLKNVRVTREWNWHNKKSDETVTDESGDFSFPSVHERSISQYLPAEIAITQKLSVRVNGEEVEFWINAKDDGKENSEYGGDPIDLTCELSNEKVLIEKYGSLMLTMCKKGVD